MRNTLNALASGAIVVAAFQTGISLPLFVASFRALRMGLARVTASWPDLIDTMVDWLEAAYGGPINS
jgi:hypothetical protein